MSDTVRQQIVDAVKTRFKTISVANGYQTNIGAKVFVCRAVPPVESEAAVGVMNIWDMEEDSKPALSRVHEHAITFHVYVTKVGTGAAEWLRNVVADIARAIGTDMYWSELAVRSEPGKNEYELDQENKINGTVRYQFKVIYRTPSWDAFNVA